MNEDFIEKGLLFIDLEVVFNVILMWKQLMRENSGESSGFEEMIFDKEMLSLSFIFFMFSVECFYVNNFVDNVCILLVVLFDLEMVVVVNEKVGKGEKFLCVMFVQRCIRLLIKQCLIDEDIIFLYVFFFIFFVLFDFMGIGGSLGMKLSCDVLWLGVNINYVKSKLNSDVLNFILDDNVIDQNFNIVLNFVQEKFVV